MITGTCPGCGTPIAAREVDPAAINAETAMLREFYRSWVALHSIPKDKLHRRQQEAAAQLLVDNAHALRLLYQGSKVHEPAVGVAPKLEVVRA